MSHVWTVGESNPTQRYCKYPSPALVHYRPSRVGHRLPRRPARFGKHLTGFAPSACRRPRYLPLVDRTGVEPVQANLEMMPVPTYTTRIVIRTQPPPTHRLAIACSLLCVPGCNLGIALLSSPSYWSSYIYGLKKKGRCERNTCAYNIFVEMGVSKPRPNAHRVASLHCIS